MQIKEFALKFYKEFNEYYTLNYNKNFKTLFYKPNSIDPCEYGCAVEDYFNKQNNEYVQYQQFRDDVFKSQTNLRNSVVVSIYEKLTGKIDFISNESIFELKCYNNPTDIDIQQAAVQLLLYNIQYKKRPILLYPQQLLKIEIENINWESFEKKCVQLCGEMCLTEFQKKELQLINQSIMDIWTHKQQKINLEQYMNKTYGIEIMVVVPRKNNTQIAFQCFSLFNKGLSMQQFINTLSKLILDKNRQDKMFMIDNWIAIHVEMQKWTVEQFRQPVYIIDVSEKKTNTSILGQILNDIANLREIIIDISDIYIVVGEVTEIVVMPGKKQEVNDVGNTYWA